MQPNPPSPTASSGKFAAVFAKRTFTPLEDIPPQLTSSMKALRRHTHDGDYGRLLPQRHFAALSTVEQLQHATAWLMWVRQRQAGEIDRLHTCLWCAPDEVTFNATQHGAAAPSDAELLAIGWRPYGGRPVQEGPAI
jgi:hypothetical protein